MHAFIWKMTKFGLTGLLGMMIDFGTTWLCKERFKWNRYIANSCGFILAVLSNYWINRHWTFKSDNPLWLTEFVKFLLISLIGLSLNNTFLYIFHNRKEKNFYVAKFLAILIVFVWNFFSNFFFTFK